MPIGSDRIAELHRAEAVLHRFDRPLRRGRHENQIGIARRERLIAPIYIQQFADQVEREQGRIDKSYETEAAASAVLDKRPQLDEQIATIDEKLAVDLRVRTRLARLEQPDAIIGTPGDRPVPGPAARVWDHAAGRLAQHHAAFDIPGGLGPRPGVLDNTADSRSHDELDELVSSVRPARTLAIKIELAGIEL